MLNYYKQPISENNERLYLSAWNYLITNDNLLVPISIANWVKNYNLENYLGTLPEDILKYMTLTTMSITDIFTLCKSSKQLNIFCQNNLKEILSEKFFIETGLNTKKI